MGINISKSGGIGRYYFKENNIEYGPFQLEWILQFIDADTQVKVSNSNWCPAKQHQDFIKYFNIKEVVIKNEPYVAPFEPVKNNYTNAIIGLSIVVLLIVFGSFIINNSNKNKLSDHDIFLQKQRAIDSVNQINAEQQQFLLQQQDSINNATSFILDSVKTNQEKLIFLENKELLIEKVKNYYTDITNNEFNASNYFADNVDQYINYTNTTPDEINSLFFNKKDYTNECVIFDESTFIFQRNFENIYYFNYSINYSCFRPRKNKTQTCDVDIEIGFDKDYKIKSYKEMEIRNLTFE
jgi:predicted nucleotidyltransferase